MSALDLKDIERRMEGAIANLKNEFSGLRTGRASIAMLDPVIVSAYGADMPLNQVASVSVPESRMLSVSVWDSGLVNATDKAIRDAGLGLNPIVDGNNLRIPIPELNEERRKDMTKIAAKYSESCRIAIRNVRRDGMEILKKAEKDSEISQDEQHDKGDQVQTLTDTYIKHVDDALKTKDAEIMQV
ncbi:MAG: ribosome recycling factor [OCS116 cluster bacterium]|uniref:Ribosome-recycling factor n=1 Tax=OCS116 cluster bacterium TaxID=2030921 RepID=A0A2A4Z4K0_9PROT|nr:ribosome recycling factor [OCS116 cluster bacterium]